MRERLTIDRVLDHIYAGALDTDQWPAALRAVARYTKSRECLFQGYRISGRGTECVFSMSGEHDPQVFEDHRRVVEQFGDIRGEYAVTKSTAGTVYQDHDILSDAEIRSHPYYQEFLIPHGYRFMAMFVANGEVNENHAEAHGFSLQRTARQGPVEGDRLRRFERLIPHLSRAARLHSRIAEQSVRLELNKFVLPSSHACFVVNDRARVIQQNACAEFLMSRNDAMFVKTQRLHLKDAYLDARFLHALENPNVSFWKRVLNAATGTIEINVLRLPGSAFLPVGGRLCLVVARERSANGLEGAIREQFHLTQAEQRLVVALATDQSIAEYAQQHGLSIHTVRSHLKSCFAKTATHSQLELVRKVLRLPGVEIN